MSMITQTGPGAITQKWHRASQPLSRKPRRRVPNHSARHCPIWFGWTLNCSESSNRVLSPLIAASATFALNVAEWFRRGRFILSAPRRRGRLLEQSYHLSACPITRDHFSRQHALGSGARAPAPRGSSMPPCELRPEPERGHRRMTTSKHLHCWSYKPCGTCIACLHKVGV